MKINLDRFMKEVFNRVQDPNDIDRFNAYSIVSKYYCANASNRGLCPGDCCECVEFLRKQLELGETKKPGGALVYRMRNGIAILQETNSAKEHVPSNQLQFGDHTIVNLMDLFMDQISK